jgi:hypothetical protein
LLICILHCVSQVAALDTDTPGRFPKELNVDACISIREAGDEKDVKSMAYFPQRSTKLNKVLLIF